MALAYMSLSRVALAWYTTDLLLLTRTESAQGYHGAAVGKGRQLAKTELEKLKLNELKMKEAVYEAVSISSIPDLKATFNPLSHSIHFVHDGAKEKGFELEMSWIGAETNNIHLAVPRMQTRKPGIYYWKIWRTKIRCR
jgi:hypothetical protein